MHDSAGRYAFMYYFIVEMMLFVNDVKGQGTVQFEAMRDDLNILLLTGNLDADL